MAGCYEARNHEAFEVNLVHPYPDCNAALSSCFVLSGLVTVV